MCAFTELVQFPRLHGDGTIGKTEQAANTDATGTWQVLKMDWQSLLSFSTVKEEHKLGLISLLILLQENGAQALRSAAGSLRPQG